MLEGTGEERRHAVQGVDFDVAFVQSELRLVDVPGKVLAADVVPPSVDAALEHGPHGFDRIDVDVVRADVFASAVLDVAADVVRQTVVARVFVGMQFAAGFDVLGDLPVQRGLERAFDGHGDRLARTALAHPENGLFADRSATGVRLLVQMLVHLLPADERLVGFHYPKEFADVAPAGFAEPAEHEPSR